MINTDLYQVIPGFTICEVIATLKGGMLLFAPGFFELDSELFQVNLFGQLTAALTDRFCCAGKVLRCCCYVSGDIYLTLASFAANNDVDYEPIDLPIWGKKKPVSRICETG